MAREKVLLVIHDQALLTQHLDAGVEEALVPLARAKWTYSVRYFSNRTGQVETPISGSYPSTWAACQAAQAIGLTVTHWCLASNPGDKRPLTVMPPAPVTPEPETQPTPAKAKRTRRTKAAA